MSENYKFCQNKDCEYFPCHKDISEEQFNCLFCYCPLYFVENCGGNWESYKGIKDCSNCLIPHQKKNYEHITKRVGEEIKKRTGNFR